jgi:hypothetical protein
MCAAFTGFESPFGIIPQLVGRGGPKVFVLLFIHTGFLRVLPPFAGEKFP